MLKKFHQKFGLICCFLFCVVLFCFVLFFFALREFQRPLRDLLEENGKEIPSEIVATYCVVVWKAKLEWLSLVSEPRWESMSVDIILKGNNLQWLSLWPVEIYDPTLTINWPSWTFDYVYSVNMVLFHHYVIDLCS